MISFLLWAIAGILLSRDFIDNTALRVCAKELKRIADILEARRKP
jgi:hypothetical protein